MKIYLLYFGFICQQVFAQEYRTISGPTQGTTYLIRYQDPKNRDLKKPIEKILYEFDCSVSTYNPHSIISKINRNEKHTKLDAYFITCFNEAKVLWSITNGAFDPTVYPLVNAWGFGPEKKSNLEQQKIDSLLNFVGFDKINMVNGEIQKADPRVQLDFNAFAQGYSVDVISAFLLKKGIQNFIVEIGGEVKTHGVDERGLLWRVGIEQPVVNQKSKNNLQVIVELENMAVATSGNYRRFKEVNGQKVVHHIDPKTGKPTANNLLSASVFSENALTSDAMATGFLVLGLEQSKQFLLEHPEIQVYFIYSDAQGTMQVFITEKLETWIAQHQ